MGTNNTLDMGFKAGVKLKDKKSWIVENAINLTDGKQNVKQAREFIFKVATEAEEPIPTILTRSDAQLKRAWTEILCYITGAYNGAISKEENNGAEK